jgi:hypothetical protein
VEYIEQDIIDEVIEEVSSSAEKQQELIDQFQEDQPLVFAYLFSESFDSFTDDEKDLLLFIGLVNWRAITRVHPDCPEVTEKMLNDAEEENWELIEDMKHKSFQHKLDFLFEDYPQEDLLAVAEDMIIDDDDQFITQVAKEAIFISAKSIIDAFVTAIDAEASKPD